MQLIEVARTSAAFIIYTLVGAKLTITGAEGHLFIPTGVAISRSETGDLIFVHLVGQRRALLPDGTIGLIDGVEFKTYTREQVLTETDDLALEMELALVNEIQRLEVMQDTEIVTSIPA